MWANAGGTGTQQPLILPQDFLAWLQADFFPPSGPFPSTNHSLRRREAEFGVTNGKCLSLLRLRGLSSLLEAFSGHLVSPPI